MSPNRIWHDLIKLVAEYWYDASPGSTAIKAAVVIILAWMAVTLGGKLVEVLASRKRNWNAGEKSESLMQLVKMIFVYGVYLLAVLLLLEIFHFRIFETSDLKAAGGMLFRFIAILLISRLLPRFGMVIIDQLLFPKGKTGMLLEERRAHTLRALLRSMITYVVYFFAGMMILETFNIKTSSILAGAGIVGLAVGFGAQNLVRDVITGFFIILEDQFSVGELVSAAGLTGVVEDLGLRTTKIREWTGQLHIIPNGEIKQVTNFNRGNMLAIVLIGIGYGEDVARAMEVLRRAIEKARPEIPSIVETPEVQGVVELGESAVIIRVIAPTLPGEQWAVERMLRQRLKEALGAEGISMPYPHRVLIYADSLSAEASVRGQKHKGGQEVDQI